MGKEFVLKRRIVWFFILLAGLLVIHPVVSWADDSGSTPLNDAGQFDPQAEITVNVATSARGALEGVRVYAFTRAGSYTGKNATTDANGSVSFATTDFADGSYRFRVDYLGQHFWSEALELPDTYQLGVIIADETVEVSVSAAGGPVAGSRVYLFGADNRYLGVYRTADDNGNASFMLPAGMVFQFRADLLGGRYWSDPAIISPGDINRIGLDAGGGRLQVTVGKDPASPMAGINSYLFSDTGRYLGRRQASDLQGRVSFEVPEGVYKVRADYLGNQFWTPDTVVAVDTTIDLIIAHQDVTVTVAGEYQGSQPLENVPVYLFTAAGAYQGQKLTTGSNGQVIFSLPEQAYKFRADYLSQQYWSGESTGQDVTVPVPMTEAVVQVTGAGAALAGVKIYVFNAAGKYLGMVQTTDTDGLATFRLPAGTYKFRADYQGSLYWSDEQSLAAGQVNTVDLSTGGGVFAFTALKGENTPLVDVKCYLFSDAGRYLGLNGTTDADGLATFSLADGGYKVRLDYLGYQFWSPLYTVPGTLAATLTIPHQDVTVTVAGEHQGSQPLENVPVYLFTAAGAYQGQKHTTGSSGQVIFSLPEQSYKVRADYLSRQYWSGESTWQDAAIAIGHGSARVHVFSLNTDLSDVRLYLFSEAGKYLGWSETTDQNGRTDFLLPEGTYQFRADIEGEQVWSPATGIVAGTSTNIDFDRSPLSVALQADSDSIEWGQATSLTWTSTGAQSCTIEPGIGAVDCSGTMAVAPETTTEYTITATSWDGSEVSRVTVTVTVPDKYITATIDHTKIDEDLTDFPVTINLGQDSGANGFDASDIFSELANLDINPDDDFEGDDGDIPDLDKWFVSKGNPRIQNGMLHFDTLKSIEQVKSKFRFDKDFDIEVDWQLDANVTRSWWMAQLILYFPLNGNQWCYAGRGYTSGSGSFFRGRYNNGGDSTTITSVDAQSRTAFSLRLKRTGSTVFIYYKTGGTWESLGSAPMYDSVCEVAFYLNRGDQNPRVTGAVDNFRINSGTIVWPEGHPLLKKLAVYDANNDPCYVEIESWNAAAKEALLHARVPHISATEDTELKISYGRHLPVNDEYIGYTASLAAQKVWDEDYLGVWHLNQVPTGFGNIKDSTDYGNHGTAHHMSAANQVPVAMGTGLHFNGTDEYISFADVPEHEILGDLSIELTTTLPASLNSNLYLLNHGGGGETEDTNFDYSLRLNTAGKMYSFFEYAAGTNVVPTTQNTYVQPSNTYHLAINRDAGVKSVDFFVGGALQETSHYSSNPTGATQANLSFAAWHGNGSPDGFSQCDLKEIRLSKKRRSEGWVKAAYHSLFDTLIEYNLGPDTDGDGISDFEEINIYGTDSNLADTDGDGIDDGQEAAYWGSVWDQDPDADSLINLLDPDSDNDGVPDGEEIDKNFDPLDANSKPSSAEVYIGATIDHTLIDEDLTDFPVMLKLSQAEARDFFNRIVSDLVNALKFRVEDSRAAQCYVEKEQWDYANRTVILHVKVPLVSSTADTVLKLFYDATMLNNDTYVGETGSFPAQNVWDNNFIGVWHLSQIPTGSGNIKDSTMNAHNGTAHNMGPENQVPVVSGKGLAFNGVDEHISFADVTAHENTGDISMECLVGTPSPLSSLQIINHGGNGETEETNFDYSLRTSSAGEIYLFSENGSGQNQSVTTANAYVQANEQYHISVNRDSINKTAGFIINGDLKEAIAYANIASGGTNANLAFGAWDLNGNPGGYSEFELREVRISNKVRSQAWLKATSYSNFDDLVEYVPPLTIDTDGDGITDFEEVSIYGTNPNKADTDRDGILDGDELAYWGSDWDQDFDGDGKINLLDEDSDDDGILDGQIDSDLDTLPDWWEIFNFNNLDQGKNDDYDADGISNHIEHKLDTNPADINDRPGSGTFYNRDGMGRIRAVIRIP